MKKRIIILGPIADVGGREVEVNIIAKSLMNDYDVSILSTTYFTEKSATLNDINDISWTSLQKRLYKKNLFVKIMSVFYKIYSRGKDKNYNYISNTIIKKVYDLNKEYLDILKQELLNVEMVILPVQLTTKFLPEIIAFCYQNKIKCVVRTTGTIRKLDKNDFDFLKKADLFIHHSFTNAENMNSYMNLPYKLVDQCTMNENILLNVSLTKEQPLRFGFIGRLSEEKGIIPLTNYFIKNNYQFIIAGDGPQKEELLKNIEKNTQIQYIGLLQSDFLNDFFNKIDVLVIPSLEESGPLVGIEAMAAGKIIISTNVGAMKSRLIKTKNDFWFDIDEIQSLDEVIMKVNALDNQELIQVSESVRERYINSFSFNKIKEEYQKIVKKLIDA